MLGGENTEQAGYWAEKGTRLPNRFFPLVPVADAQLPTDAAMQHHNLYYTKHMTQAEPCPELHFFSLMISSMNMKRNWKMSGSNVPWQRQPRRSWRWMWKIWRVKLTLLTKVGKKPSSSSANCRYAIPQRQVFPTAVFCTATIKKLDDTCELAAYGRWLARGAVLAGFRDERICAVMHSGNDNWKLHIANNKNLKFHHCRDLPKFSGQNSSATDFPHEGKHRFPWRERATG